MNTKTKAGLATAQRIEKETQDWLKEHGYNPLVGRIHLDAMEFQNNIYKIELEKELSTLNIFGVKQNEQKN